MTYDCYRLIGLDCQIEVAQNCASARGVAEPNVFELDSTMSDVFGAALLGINPGRLLDYAKYEFCSRSSFC